MRRMPAPSGRQATQRLRATAIRSRFEERGVLPAEPGEEVKQAVAVAAADDGVDQRPGVSAPPSLYEPLNELGVYRPLRQCLSAAPPNLVETWAKSLAVSGGHALDRRVHEGVGIRRPDLGQRLQVGDHLLNGAEVASRGTGEPVMPEDRQATFSGTEGFDPLLFGRLAQRALGTPAGDTIAQQSYQRAWSSSRGGRGRFARREATGLRRAIPAQVR